MTSFDYNPETVRVSGTVITTVSGNAVTVSGNWVSTSGSVVTLSSGTTYIASGQTIRIPDMPTIMNDESIWLLRRIVNLLESSSVVDSKRRQLVTVEAIGRVVATGIPTEMTTTVPIAGAVTLASTTISGNVVTAGLSVGTSGYVTPNSFADAARLAYATGIRSNLSW